MRKLSVALWLLVAVGYCLAGTDEKFYMPDKASLENYIVPEWYQDAKFGIWPHWGLYSVPAYRGNGMPAWYGRWMYCIEKEPETIKLSPKKRWNEYYDLLAVKTIYYHREKYGDPKEFGYHDFAPMWKAEKWDPDAWAQMAVDAGAKFFCMMGVHHDSFCLYDSDLTEWDAVDKGPKRDLVAEMKQAAKKKGLKFGLSNHMAWNHEFFKYYRTNGFDKGQEEYADLYSKGVTDQAYMKRWWDRTRELAEKYQPDLYYFDWGWHGKPWSDGKYHEKFASFYYNKAIEWGYGEYGKPEVVLNSKYGPMSSYCVHDLERAKMSTARKYVWQTDTSISPHCWGYAADDDSFFSTTSLVTTLMDIVSKNGILMLNYGPRADGTVSEGYYSRLMGMGKWLRSNGEAVYSTRPWKVAAEGPTDAGSGEAEVSFTPKDIRYTRSKDGKKIYATAFGLPYGKLTLFSTKVRSISKSAKVTMLANGNNIAFETNGQKQLVLDLSDMTLGNAGCRHAYSFRIEGMEIDGTVMGPMELSEIYIHDIKDHDPLGKAYKSQYPYLSAITPVFEKAHNDVKRDVNYGNRTITIGGKTYEHGLMVCPTADGNKGIFIVKMKKMPKIKGFAAEIGIDDAVKAGNSGFMIDVYVNGEWQQVYKSRVLTHKDKAVKVDVKLPAGTEFVRFITTDGGNGCSADHAVWADAKFY